MNSEDMKRRTKVFGLRVIELVDDLPPGKVAGTIGYQLLRSATSVGANYRAACRGRSKPDFISIIGIAIEEADESLYWMELLVDSGIVPGEKTVDLMREGNELVAILTASSKTARARLANRKG
jgi:four helix bundle protein